jgi:23S rRNA (cytosine1962-C5)-methyltransferase
MTPKKIKSPSTPHRSSQGGRDFRNRVQRSAKLTDDQKKPPRDSTQPHTGLPDAEPCLILKSGREKSLQRRHPWIFSGAIASVNGAPKNGETLAVRSEQGEFLAWAAYNAASQISARVWSWREEEIINAAFFRAKITNALAARSALLNASSPVSLNHNQSGCDGQPVASDGNFAPSVRRGISVTAQNNGMRLIHAESDGLPGLIVDQYGDVLVLQIGSAGAEHWRDSCVDILQELCNPACIYERSDSDSRALEGLALRSGLLRGKLPNSIAVVENGLRFRVDVAAGQKTGFYLDQRDNRALTETLARDKDVLNCFCYTGGFSLYAMRGGAKSVLSIDASGTALQIAAENLTDNGLDATRAEWQEADVFQALRKLRDQGRSFDLIILDPPKFAPTAAFAEKAARGYKDINLLGFKLLRPGGILATYSCSGGISEELFQKIIAGAALDAGVNAQIIHYLHASSDHPVLLSFPEGAYLKGLILRVGL